MKFKPKDSNPRGYVEPFLKWAGGKRWLVNAHKDIFNVKFGRYIEPFVGGGSVYFYLAPENAVLADKNRQLIDTYRAIKTNWKQVNEELFVHSLKHSKNYYYEIRALKFNNIYSSAAQLLYLNRTCWNGLYRVNKKGEFNVPIGTKNKVILNSDNFENVSKMLANADIYNCDFENIIDKADNNDLLFIDPPYTVNHNNNGFIKYNQHIFSWEDQVRLSKCVLRAKQRGAIIILTNADHESIRELYESDFVIKSVSRASVLSGKAMYRGKVTELLVTN